jgi:hypothetical protein
MPPDDCPELDLDGRPVAGLSCILLGLICLAHAVGIVLFLDEAKRDPTLITTLPDPDDGVTSVFHWVANNVHPRLGKWGCVLLFAVPAAVLMLCGVVMLRRWRGSRWRGSRWRGSRWRGSGRPDGGLRRQTVPPHSSSNA